VNPTFRSAVVACLALVGVASPVTLHAATQIFAFNYRGAFVHAEFSSLDASGDIQTDVIVDAASINPARPSEAALYPPVASVFIHRFSRSTGASLFTGAGGDSMASLTVSPTLATAHLASRMLVQDFFTGAALNVSIALDWTATGPVSVGTSNFHSGTPQTFFYDNHSQGKQQSARAGGTVTDGATNFTPESSVNALIQTAVAGSVNLQVQQP
jgi:hypothetical protein